MHEAVKEKRSRKLTHSMLLHNDNALAHTSYVVMVAVHECGFKIENDTVMGNAVIPL